MFDNLREAWRIIRGEHAKSVVAFPVDLTRSRDHWTAFYPAATCPDRRALYYANGHTGQQALDNLHRVLTNAIANDYARTYPQKATQCATPPLTP